MKCPPCNQDRHDECEVSHMGMLQAFCGCPCPKPARDQGLMPAVTRRIRLQALHLDEELEVCLEEGERIIGVSPDKYGDVLLVYIECNPVDDLLGRLGRMESALRQLETWLMSTLDCIELLPYGCRP